MRYIIAIAISLFVSTGFAQQITYKEFQDAASSEINLRPEYGNVIKDKGYIEEDKKFIDIVLKEDITHRKGSEHMVQLGFKYLYSGDLKTAMRRFNQAWLLDPKNENAYWGFGAVYGYFSDYKAAIIQYDKGLAINPNSSIILTDKATLHFVLFQHDGDHVKLDTAIELLKRSYAIDPKNTNTTFKLSICYFLNKDCTNAWKFYDECKEQGGQPITVEYTEALKKQCNK